MHFVRAFGLLATSASLAAGIDLTGYEYVVVGSGAGGGPVAARLALAGHKTLLLEAGDDQGENVNYTVPAFSGKSSEDEALAWNFFVRHYADETRQARDFKTTYETPDGGEYTGLNPPQGSTMKGTLYPRTGTLGGCTAHHALITVYPHESDFERIASLTGDSSWSPENMRKYFIRMEKNQYLAPGAAGHGYDGWLETENARLNIVLNDEQLLSMVSGGGFALGNETGVEMSMESLITGDANAYTPTRDSTPSLYQIPISTNDGRRAGAREFVVAVRDATNEDGSKKYPLDVRLNSHVTKVTFEKDSNPPRATGVEFLDGQHLYRASPLCDKASGGVPGTASASREVIVAGGAYNSPQILKLSGIGPEEELNRFGIPVVKHLPGVGTNLQDHYEITVQGRTPANFTSLDGCTFGFVDGVDECLQKWQNAPPGGDRGLYASPGVAVGMFYKSTTTERGEYDVFLFGGPINFRGYFPRYSINATNEHDWFSWTILKGHPRNTAGSVTLASADPLDVPDIVYNYFDTGVGDSDGDVQAMFEAIGLARDAFARQAVPVSEELPGADVVLEQDVKTYVKDTAWGHHASSTCPIGPDSDAMAVLDSKFRVRGVNGLRVVDASVYPHIPGTFTAVSTFMAGEKAADDILAHAASETGATPAR